MTRTDFAQEQRAVRVKTALALAFCLTVSGAFFVVGPKLVTLPSTLADRLALGLQASIPHFLWMLFAVMRVSRGRLGSAADIDGSANGPPSAHLAPRVAFLQNTFEQAFLAVGGNLVLVSLVDGRWLTLPLAGALLFSIGRLSFFRTLANGAPARAFGMSVTMLPTVFCFGVAIFQLPG